ncbi:MAG: hypothetical protein HKN88_09855 [Gammaproteobacteria bacterium]|nr:hypothetical protein [Gammaproteobacteria bacterium]NNC98361.1 hypothetical protein [Gammaproteobacteria bacterium]
MNSLVVTEGILLSICLYGFWVSDRTQKALLMVLVLIGLAALLGLLKFSGILPLPELHALLAMLSSCVALPLLAVTMVWPTGPVSKTLRYMSIFSFIMAFIGVMLVTIGEFTLWRTICALISALVILLAGLWRKQWLVFIAGVLLVVALAVLGAQKNVLGLLAVDWMHLLLSVSLVVLVLHFKQTEDQKINIRSEQ